MAEDRRMTAADVAAQVMAGEHGDFVRDAVALVARELMEAEICGEVGAQLGEVSDTRVTHRNGYRPRAWETRVGEIELLIPRKRQGPAYFPSFLEPRRRSEQAIVAVVLEAYVNGVSTRKVDRLVEQLGIGGMTKDRVSALCRALDEQVEVFRHRPLEAPIRICGWMPSTSRSAPRHVRSKALVVAYAVHETGCARSSAWTSARSSPAASGSSSCVRSGTGLDVSSWLSLIITRAQARDRAGACVPVAAVHGALRAQHARPLPPPPARLVSAALREVFNAEDHRQARERVTHVIERLAPSRRRSASCSRTPKTT